VLALMAWRRRGSGFRWPRRTVWYVAIGGYLAIGVPAAVVMVWAAAISGGSDPIIGLGFPLLLAPILMPMAMLVGFAAGRKNPKAPKGPH
jgi:hypothetical protein